MFLTIFILSLVFIGIALLGLGINIFFRKKPFPETSVGHNKEMRRRKIFCIKTQQVIIDKNINKDYNSPNCSGC